MYTVGPPHLQNPNHGSKTVQVLIKKYLLISGPMQFKSLLSKSQLYLPISLFGHQLMDIQFILYLAIMNCAIMNTNIEVFV